MQTLLTNLFLVAVLGLLTWSCTRDNVQSFVSHKVENLFNRSTSDANETQNFGVRILKIAETSKEFSYGYSLIADGLYKKEEYSNALIFYKKVDSISILLNDDDRRFITNLFMTGIYNKVGLLSRADESLNLCNTLIKRSAIPYSQYYLLIGEANLLELSYKYCEAIPKRKELVAQILNISHKEGGDKSILADSYMQLAYNQIKCGQLSEAGLSINKADSLVREDQYINNTIIIAIYKMVKGMYAAEVNDYDQAVIYFDEALDNAKKNNLNLEKMKILQERINYNFDRFSVRKRLIKEFNDLEVLRKKQMGKIIEQEVDHKNTIIRKKERYQIILVSISLISLVAMFILIKVFETKRKMANKKFNHILLQIKENSPERNEDNTSQLSISRPEEEKDKTLKGAELTVESKKNSDKKILSDKKEMDLLNKLEKFEAGKEFLNNNYSISSMATQFETNSKYINFILQKHRNKTFSDYINSLRILYITRLLYEETEYRNYKISYLSEVCGYSSHSRFTSVFKTETGLSPSDFINKISGKSPRH
ncbi:helix-turn-helix transcriptional regulator [Chryseobacterium sp. SN22]|uniref:helix-turn-helix domain-containing protein n=1 Tax=Chryseobacterium sp. SN22 TaxID=2606431 RepID=UPI0011ECCE9A|nr:helix-turn-helix domain-containing protein [Chryseobacterium sp. SN22]KAA0127321.1 helix-turn-helix transcriptional regulator [Chryseobacterium sp. SN22]